MSFVVNRTAFKVLYDQLGWPGSFDELVDNALASGLPDNYILAYLQALAASPAGLDDTQIVGCPAPVAAQITNFLHSRGLVGV